MAARPWFRPDRWRARRILPVQPQPEHEFGSGRSPRSRTPFAYAVPG